MTFGTDVSWLKNKRMRSKLRLRFKTRTQRPISFAGGKARSTPYVESRTCLTAKTNRFWVRALLPRFVGRVSSMYLSTYYLNTYVIHKVRYYYSAK